MGSTWKSAASSSVMSASDVRLGWTRTKSWTCDSCGNKFSSKMALEEHSNVHSGVRPYKCDLCDASFTRRSTLWNHRRVHTTQRQFGCPFCSAKFRWKNSLQSHIQCHERRGIPSRELESHLNLSTLAGSKDLPNVHETSQMNFSAGQTSSTVLDSGGQTIENIEVKDQS